MTNETIDDLLSDLGTLAFDRDPDCPMIPYDYREKFYEAVRDWLRANGRLGRLVDQRDAAVAACRKLDELDWCIGYDLGLGNNQEVLHDSLTMAREVLTDIEETEA